MVTHDTTLVSVPKEWAMDGRATFTMLPSMPSISTPSTIVAMSSAAPPFAMNPDRHADDIPFETGAHPLSTWARLTEPCWS